VTTGNLIVGQSGGVTPVINSSLAGVIAAAIDSPLTNQVYGMRHGVRGLLDKDIIRLDGKGEGFYGRLRETPGAWLGSCRYAPSDDELEQILETLVALHVRYYIYIGGNDSADTSARLAALARDRRCDLAVINVPKTIDNDLPDMDHCPGYATAAAYVALSVRLLALDTRAMRREEPVRVIEVKGRHSGWLAAAAGAFDRDAAAGPTRIFVPEQPLDAERALEEVQSALSRHDHAVLVVSEHAVDATGKPVGESPTGYTDAFGHDDSHGPGAFLQSLVQTDLKRRCRLEVLGAMQKVSLLPACELDRREAFDAGRHAVHLALAGKSGLCVTLERSPGKDYRLVLGDTDLDRIARTERVLPAEYMNGSVPTPAFREWIAPLVEDARPYVERLLDGEDF
jgi:6-phosphofructokinase 1